MSRPQLQKVMFTYDPDSRLKEAVHQTIPGATVVIAATNEERAREVAGTNLTIGPGLDAELLDRADALVWHHVPWAGVEHMDLGELARRRVMLTNSRGISAPNMAEHVLAMMLAFGRALPVFMEEQQRRSWRGWDEAPSIFELTDQTVVLLGTGAIGQEVAKRLRPFGCRIIGVRRRPAPIEGFDQVVGFEGLRDILSSADHVVSSLPMTPFTEKIVDREFIQQMKSGSHFYNVGRGRTVDQDALIAALHSGHLGGAGLDVTDPEPLPQDSPLWDAPNTIITGHTSGGSPRTGERAAKVLRENLKRYLDGDELINVVDLEYGY